MAQSHLIADALENIKVFKILGMTFFSIENGKSVTRWQDVLYMLTMIGIGAFICYYFSVSGNRLSSEGSKIASIGNFLAKIASIIIVMLSVFITFIFRHKIWLLATKLDTIEQKLLEIGSKPNSERTLQIYGCSCISVLLIIMALEYLVYVLQGSLVQVILDLYSCIYFSINIGICTIVILSIAMKLRRINLTCKSMLIHHDYGNSILMTDKNQEIDTISKIYEIYSGCMDACDLINLCFMFQLMLGCGLTFFFTILTSFCIYKDYTSFQWLTSDTTIAVAFCLYYNLLLVLIIFVCYDASEEANVTLKLAIEMIKESNEMSKTLMLVTLTTFIKKHRPKFTCGLFDFDWKLAFANLSSAATNFVILMQFDIASKY